MRIISGRWKDLMCPKTSGRRKIWTPINPNKAFRDFIYIKDGHDYILQIIVLLDSQKLESTVIVWT